MAMSMSTMFASLTIFALMISLGGSEKLDVVSGLEDVDVGSDNSTGSCSASDVNCNDITVTLILENQFNDAPNQLAYMSTTPSSTEDGSSYIGEWLGNEKHGSGMYTAPDGSRYIGRWENDMRIGWSTQTYPEGKYVGDFSANVRHGMGTFYFENGDKFYGQWEDDSRTGPGILTLDNGDKYMGRWSEDGSSGFGAFIPAGPAIDSTPRDGKDANGRKRGQGICLYENGDYFIGEWYSDPTGSAAATAVENARDVQRKTTETVDGDCHWDTPTDGAAFGTIMFHGQGFNSFYNGDIYIGEYQPSSTNPYSERHGQGQLSYADGSKYIGEFEHGHRHGDGIFTSATGQQAIGQWASDEMIQGNQ